MSIFTCKKCNHQWEIDKNTQNPYLCYKCAYNNKTNKYEYELAGQYWLQKVADEADENQNAVLNEATDRTHKTKFGCLMLYFDFPKWDDLIANVPEKMVYDAEGYGKETEPHTTVLYGFHQNSISIEELKQITSKVKSPISVTVTDISTFKAKDYDVLKFDCKSDILTKLNEIFKLYPHTNTFKDYHPHITISYIKPNNVTEDLFKALDKPIIIISNEFRFSEANGNKESFSINNTDDNKLYIDDFDIDDILSVMMFEMEETDNIADALDKTLIKLSER